MSIFKFECPICGSNDFQVTFLAKMVLHNGELWGFPEKVFDVYSLVCRECGDESKDIALEWLKWVRGESDEIMDD